LSPFRRTTYADPQLEANQVRVYCGASPTRFWPLAIVVYQGILSLAAAFFAFKTRNMYDKLNESKSVALANYNIMFSTFTSFTIFPRSLLTVFAQLVLL
jgi:hypothetical protein